MAQVDRFCTQYLLHNHCDDGDLCVFKHANQNEVKLSEPLLEKSVFVGGCFINCANQKRICKSDSIGWGNRACPAGSVTEIHLKDISAASELNNLCYMDLDGPSTSSDATTVAIVNSQNDPKNTWGEASSTCTDKPYSVSSLELFQNKYLNIDAPEFIPRTRFNSTSNSEKRLCPYAERDGFCKYPKGECTYLHGDNCDLCGRPALHPYNDVLKKKHVQECIKRHERDMELAFAVARSKEKICGICFEVIMQKCKEEQRFGILPSCNHCFCLSCIRRWRQSKQFENKIIRSCPECRIASDFVCPSAFWVDTKEDKDKLIEKYKQALAKKDCKYFRFGRGKCPFGNKCFYRHCLQNGTKVDVGPPPSANNANHSEGLNDYPTTVEIIQLLEVLQDVVYGDLGALFDGLFLEDTDSESWSD